MGIVVLATFITGVFAVPEQQLLNVFVTNFPQNETRLVFSENFTVAANTEFSSGFIPTDVSQFRHARVMVEVMYGLPLDTVVLHLEVTPAFPASPPATYTLDASVTTTGAATNCASGSCTTHTMVDGMTVDTPLLLIVFRVSHVVEDIEFTGRVIALLQR